MFDADAQGRCRSSTRGGSCSLQGSRIRAAVRVNFRTRVSVIALSRRLSLSPNRSNRSSRRPRRASARSRTLKDSLLDMENNYCKLLSSRFRLLASGKKRVRFRYSLISPEAPWDVTFLIHKTHVLYIRFPGDSRLASVLYPAGALRANVDGAGIIARVEGGGGYRSCCPS